MAQDWKNWIKNLLGILGISMGKQHKEKTTRTKNRNSQVANEKFNALTQVLQPAYTRRLRPEPEEETVSPLIDQRTERIVAPLLLAWHGVTDTGMVRPHNEDSFSSLALEIGTLFVVADGMGGHDAGEIASRIAVDTVCQEMREGVEQSKDLLALVEHAVHQANTAVKQEGANRGSNMGTTLSVAFVADTTAYIANVGDSRIYWIENGSISQITEDHSLVAKLVAAGKLTREEARNHPKSNLLYRTVGTDSAIKVDTFRVGLKKGGNLLLCTDGLWGMIADENIHQVCAAEKDIKKICARLVRMANENGGHDNITAVVVKVV
jgi:serine/threonine protein phosphatase PrpC